MTTTEAINILDQAASIAALPRRDHVAVQQAIEVLKKLVGEVLVGEVKEAEHG